MKKMKIVILLLIVLILSGCSVKSDITVNYDGTVDEKVIFPTELKNVTESEFNEQVNLYLDNYMPAIRARNYSYTSNYSDKTVVVYNKFSNLCDYIEKTIFSQYLYKHISCVEDENYITIKNETEHIAYISDSSFWPALDKVDVNIKLPVKAYESDADIVDDRNNIYTWNFSKDTSNYKNIKLVIDKNDLKKESINFDRKQKINKNIQSLGIVLVLFIFIIIIGLFCLKLYSNYKKSKISY